MKLPQYHFHSWHFFGLIWLVLFFFFPKFPGKLINWDNNPTYLLPIAIVKDHRLSFEGLRDGQAKLEVNGTASDLKYWFVVDDQKHVLSGYPIFNGLMMVPSYLIASVIYPKLWTVGTFPDPVLIDIGLTTSVSLSVLTAFIFYRTILLRTKKQLTALLCAAVFVFGTPVVSVSSRAPWQHTFTLLFISLALYLFQKKSYLPLILFSLLATLCRPSALLICAPFLFWTVYLRWKESKLFQLRFIDWAALIASIGAIGIQIYYSTTYLHSLFAFAPVYKASYFAGNAILGLAGLLISPSKGIFIYTPVFVVALLQLLVLYRRKSKTEFWLFSLALGSFTLLTAQWKYWYGGGSIGYRMLLEAVPLLIILMGDWFSAQQWKETGRVILVALAIFIAVLFNTQISANYGDCLFHAYPTDIDHLSQPEQLKRIWLHSPIVRCMHDFQRN